MRLIDADALIESIPDNAEPDEFENCGSCGCMGKYALRDFINDAPTISPDEARGVVHCKDCKWCHAGYCEKYDDLIPFGCANKPWEDWFCADGKRREAKKEAQDAD